MTARLVLATGNDAKVAELRDILAGLDVQLLSAADCAAAGHPLDEVDETGQTFAANALLKACAGVEATGLPCVADDSGLVVDALDGAPGIRSARYAVEAGRHVPDGGGRQAVDDANLRLLLEQLEGVEPARRTARFVCAAVLALPDGTSEVVEATMEGHVVDGPRGDGGFGYDPVFVPDGHDRTTAEMTAAEKHTISHRGRAFRALRAVIVENLTG